MYTEAPFSLAKIVAPRLPRIVYRSRLIEALESNAHKKLVLILGQAAQGKSTLAAAFMRESNVPAAWVSLGGEDSDPVSLFHLLAQSLRHATSASGLSALLTYPATSLGPRAQIPLYREWSQSLLRGITPPFRIILDNLDRLPADAPAFELLRVLVEETPPNIQLIMVSRAAPPFDVQRLKLNGDAAVLTNDLLAFTLDETTAFFKEVFDPPLPPEEVRRIQQLTEGWVGGLVMFCEALWQIRAGGTGGSIFEGIVDRFRQEVFQYLGAGVFSLLAPETRELLVKSSILEVVEPGFVNELMGTDDSERILRGLADKNLFVRAVYHEKGLLFQYHQLLRDYLRTRLKSEMSAEERRHWLYKAARICERNGENENAIDLYLRAEAYPEAASVVERIGLDLLKGGRTEDIVKWVRSLPEETVRENPWLLLYLSAARRFTEIKDNISRLRKALHRFENEGDTRGEVLALAYLIEAVTFIGCSPIPVESLVERGEGLLRSLSTDLFPYERAVLWCQIGLGHRRGECNARKAYWACRNAHVIAKDIGAPVIQANALCNELQALSFLGEFSTGDQVLDELEDLVTKSPYPELVSNYLTFTGSYFTFKGELARAEELLGRAQAEVDKHGLIYLQPIVLVHRFFLRAFLDEPEEIEKLGAHMLNLASSTGNKLTKGVAAMLMGGNAYRKGRLERAREWIEQAIPIFSSGETRLDYHFHNARVIRSLICYHLREHQGLEGELDDALKYYTHQGYCLPMPDTHWALALIEWSRGRMERAAAHLLAGFKIARQKGYYHFTLISPRDVARSCTLALELEIEEVMDYAARLLATTFASEAAGDLERLSRCSNLRVARRAMDLKRSVHRSKVPLLRIQTLGGFRVLRGDCPIPEEEWGGNLPRQVLMAVIVRGSRRASAEELIEDIWPEQSASMGLQNFKVNLHRLRKVLEPGMDKGFGSSYVLLKANHVSLNEELCSVDVNAFLSLARKGRDAVARKDAKAVLALFEEAIELYRGDFLSNIFYAPWAAARREELHREYLGILVKTAELYEQRGASRKATACYKKAIQAEPLMEEAVQKLMLLSRTRGMRNAALKVYSEYKEALHTELASEPDELTRAIYESLFANK